ncbi:LysR family transcriptional regulator, partial [Acinetobacter baumannii]
VRNTDLAGIVAKQQYMITRCMRYPIRKSTTNENYRITLEKGKTDETVVKEFTNVIRNVLNCTSSNLI